MGNKGPASEENEITIAPLAKLLCENKKRITINKKNEQC